MEMLQHCQPLDKFCLLTGEIKPPDKTFRYVLALVKTFCASASMSQLSPSPLHSHKISQKRHGHDICDINFIMRVQLKLLYLVESIPVLRNYRVFCFLVICDEQFFDT